MKNRNAVSLNQILASQRNNKYISEGQLDPILAYHLKVRTEKRRSEQMDNIKQKENNHFIQIVQLSENTAIQENINSLNSQQNLLQSAERNQEITNQNNSNQKYLINSPKTNIPNSNSTLIKEYSTQNNINERSASSQFLSKRNISPLEKVKLKGLKSIESSPSKPTSNNSLKSPSIIKILPQLTTRRTSLIQNVGQSLNDLKTEYKEIMSAKTERQNIFLKQQEEKQKQMHFDLKNSINRLNNQSIVKDAANLYGQVDCFLAGSINYSNYLQNQDNVFSLNQKLMEEGIIANTSQVSFIKKRKKKQEETQSDTQAEELYEGKLRKQHKTQIKSKNDLDDILGTKKKQEREEILAKVAKFLMQKKQTKNNGQNNYNKWYINPEYRNVQRVDRQEKLYPYAFDQNYLYNNIENYEELYRDNPFDKKLAQQRQQIKDSQKLKIENLRSMLVNSDVIKSYTKQLVQNGERIPLFMKEVFDQDAGKVKARSSLLNRYYNQSTESDKV
ncbi:hypothetical protein TTHERM_00151260 (macronuclear) [Tetrahymena thermophila SB210]|uniref:Uncharacterized protein n=1 Tax=Tetrahymena thermophila (strain SB210) TaxID=312017 RepID=I7LWD3_TETTS|nr:hypothetical protein TTHERM_00151260 [Tetrahymena thermophila SB210]EAS01416.2 hypothetical protein TTHERM_00151260 [Tetrahymena thermophila SB210]|eukprot:XP_001021662.2 hypothetical protein TTHERM_00151260 [Tetrahymena thermophila SB210]